MRTRVARCPEVRSPARGPAAAARRQPSRRLLAAPPPFADNPPFALAARNDQRRVAPHCRVVNLVRSGRKQPQRLTASAGGTARHPMLRLAPVRGAPGARLRRWRPGARTANPGIPTHLRSRTMSYQVLARKWRPKIFAELVGRSTSSQALTHALDAQRLHHAYLLTGTRGVGKTTIARILAKASTARPASPPRPAAPARPAPTSTPAASSTCSSSMRRPTPASTTCASCSTTRATRRRRGASRST